MGQIPPVQEKPVTSHFQAKSRFITNGTEILDELLKREMVYVEPDRQSRPMFTRHIPSGNTVYRCVNKECEYRPESKARSYKELEFARKETERWVYYYLCPFCGGSEIEVLRGGRWKQVADRPTQWFKCKICGVRRPTPNGIVQHYRLIRKNAEEHRKILWEIQSSGELR